MEPMVLPTSISRPQLPTSIGRPQLPDHPVFKEMTKDGVNEDLAFAAMIVYLDLFERKHWWHLDFVFNPVLATFIIFGSKTRNGHCHAVIPIRNANSTSAALSIRKLRTFLKEAPKSFEMLQTEKASFSSIASPRVTMAMLTTDATLVYYQIANGLLKPAPPLNAVQRLEREARRRICRTLVVGGEKVGQSEVVSEGVMEDMELVTFSGDISESVTLDPGEEKKSVDIFEEKIDSSEPSQDQKLSGDKLKLPERRKRRRPREERQPKGDEETN